MGMDVYGIDPTTEAGRYFRNNMWWWRPLADFLVSTYPELTSMCRFWHTNDGDGLDAVAAIQLADALDADLANGSIAVYARTRQEVIASMPYEECDLCGGTGIRTDEVGQALGLDTPHDPMTGRGGCNGCQGQGKREPWLAHYPFSVENVTEFATFLRGSGGFTIH
jgi:hypothetical protein